MQGEGGKVARDLIRGRSNVEEEEARRAAGEVELHVGGWDIPRGQRDDGRDDRGRQEGGVEDEDGETEDAGGEMGKGEFGNGWWRAVADGGN